MRIENIRIWQWMLIGGLVGLAFGALKVYQGPWFDSDQVMTLDSARFEREMINVPDPFRRFQRDQQQYVKDPPFIKQVTVTPPLGGADGNMWWVSGKSYTVTRTHKVERDPKSPMVLVGEWLPFKYPATAPYKAKTAGVGTYPTVLDYLNTVAKRNPKMVPFQYDWRHQPRTTYLSLSTAGVLIIGLAWPATLAILQNAGFARKREKRVKLASARTIVNAAGPAVDTAAVKAQLDDLNADLEASLAGFGAASVSPTAVIAAEAPRPVTAASTGVTAAVDAAPRPPTTEDEDKEFGGEFYPVARVATHKK